MAIGKAASGMASPEVHRVSRSSSHSNSYSNSTTILLFFQQQRNANLYMSWPEQKIREIEWSDSQIGHQNLKMEIINRNHTSPKGSVYDNAKR